MNKSIEKYFNFDFQEFNKLKEIKTKQIYQTKSERLFVLSVDNTENSYVIRTKIKEDLFSFSLDLNNFDDNNKHVIVICIRDNSNILDFVLSRLVDSAKTSNCDVLIVDDRSSSSEVFEVAEKYNASCLRVVNKNNIFSYSMLNNLAAAVVKKFNKKYCIFWNCDMWPPDDETLGNLLVKHHSSQAVLSGTKLLYPNADDYNKIFGNYKHAFGDISKYFGKIQHAGTFFCQSIFADENTQKISSYLPVHSWRFYDANYFMTCFDSFCFAVTGAFWIISTDDFTENGGLNPSMPILSQDMDFCLKLILRKKPVFYIGSESLYHAEDILITNLPVPQEQKNSDNLLYEHLWKNKIKIILGLDAEGEQNLEL